MVPKTAVMSLRCRLSQSETPRKA